MPEKLDVEDLMNRLYLLQKIEAGEIDIAEGKTVPHKEADERLSKKWQNWSGSAGKNSTRLAVVAQQIPLETYKKSYLLPGVTYCEYCFLLLFSKNQAAELLTSGLIPADTHIT